MSTAAKQEKADGRRRPRRRRRKWFGVWGNLLVTLMAVACVALAFLIYQHWSLEGDYRLEYEGRVVGKSLTVVETGLGSGQRLRLRIRPRTGPEFQVAVNHGLYERAREGMWIKRSREGVKLSWEAPGP